MGWLENKLVIKLNQHEKRKCTAPCPYYHRHCAGIQRLTNTVSKYFPSFVNYLYLAVQLIAAWWLIMKSGDLSLRIAEKTGANESFKIVTTSKGLLQVVLIAIGIYFVILNITYIINFLIDEYRERNQYQVDGKSPFVASLLIKILTILPAAVLTAYSGSIAAYFIKKTATEPVTIEQEIEEIKAAENNTAP
jgi:hypothetical protein